MLRMPPVPFQHLPEQGVLLLDGPDAVAFLQGQVTVDVTHLVPARAMLGALCTAQGRVIAITWIGRTAAGLALVLPRELAAPLAGRLARFVLRSKVTIRDASAGWSVAGACGFAGEWPALPDGWEALLLPQGRLLAIGPAALAATPPGVAGGAGSWGALCVALGEPEVYAATSEAWLPQMLNLDLLDAVSLTKGCYTGQEVVARLQYRGRVKRRLMRYRYAGVGGLTVGSPLCHGDTEVGTVVRLAGVPQQGELLAVVGTESAGLALSDARRQVTCTPLPLPYPLPPATGPG